MGITKRKTSYQLTSSLVNEIVERDKLKKEGLSKNKKNVKVFIYFFRKKEMTFLFEPLEPYAFKETCTVPEKEDLSIYSN